MAKGNFKDSTKALRLSLKKDKGLRESWVSNIAMAYIDNEAWYKQKTGKKHLNKRDKHTIANNAAKYFIQLLID